MSASVLHKLGGTGPDVLLLHGFGADRLSWVANAPALSAGATVWAADLPGHGAASDEVGDGSPEAMARDLLGALDAVPGPMVVVGHSMGGAVALHLAALGPERVTALVLLAPAGLGGAPNTEFLLGFAELDTVEAARTMLERLVVRKRLIQPAMAQHVLAGLGAESRRAALRTVGKVLTQMALPPWPPAQPVRLIWGADDAINALPEAAQARFADVLTLLPDTGHLPQVEAASKVNAAVLEALEL